MNCESNGHYAGDNREHLENGSVKERIQTFRRLSISGSVLQLEEVCMSVVQC
jgi:hypothetical protein